MGNVHDAGNEPATLAMQPDTDDSNTLPRIATADIDLRSPAELASAIFRLTAALTPRMLRFDVCYDTPNAIPIFARVVVHSPSLPNNLYQHPLPPLPVKLIVKNVLPRPQMQFSVRNRHHHFAPHNLSLVMRVRVVLA